VQVRAYAEYLGMDLDTHPELTFLAKHAMDAKLPSEWNAHYDADGEEYFHNMVTGVSQYEHPLDEAFSDLYRMLVANEAATDGALSDDELADATARAGALQMQ
jgi:hypothetical protein